MVSGSTTRHSTPKLICPTVVRNSACSSIDNNKSAALKVHVDAMGLVSVIPHACKIGRPVCSRYASLKAFGTAEPPQGMARNDEVSRPLSSGRTPIQIVGTPAATVTFSSTMSCAMALPERSGPGITNDAPEATAACARPHALAWNIGTTGKITSLSRAPKLSTVIAPNVCRYVLRWLYTTPFGLPVVPLV